MQLCPKMLFLKLSLHLPHQCTCSLRNVSFSGSSQSSVILCMRYGWYLRELRAQGTINNTEIGGCAFLLYDGFLYLRTELESAQIQFLLQAHWLATLKPQKAKGSNSPKQLHPHVTPNVQIHSNRIPPLARQSDLNQFKLMQSRSHVDKPWPERV